ncbi:MAG: MBL fold metallo-hydrolase [Pseudomonadota bacterium]
MLLLDRRTVFKAGAAAALAPSLAAGAGHSDVNTMTASPMGSFVHSTMVVGDENLLVIDAQLTRDDAVRLADQIAATGKRLETVFITHLHPDHLMGIHVLSVRFPEATFTAHPAVAEILGQMGQGMVDGLKSNLGYAPGDSWVLPTPLDGDLTLEGARFKVLGPMAGDTAVVTPVHLPQFDALVTSDVVYSGTGLWVAETTTDAALAAWRASLDTLEAVGAGRIIAGHNGPAPGDAGAIAFTRAYLDGWEQALAEGTDRASLAAAMERILGANPAAFFTVNALNAVYPE